MRADLSKFRIRDSRGMLLNNPTPIKDHADSADSDQEHNQKTIQTQISPGLKLKNVQTAEYKQTKDEVPEIKTKNPEKLDVNVTDNAKQSDDAKSEILMNTQFFAYVGANGEITQKVSVSPKQRSKIEKYLFKTNHS